MKIILFLVFIELTLYGCFAEDDSYLTINGTRRSGVCLIENVAAFNKIDADFELINKTKIDGMDHFRYKLTLGTEVYNSSATSKKGSKEKVSRQAYALTKYNKPPLDDRTCIIQTAHIKSNLSILHEYATSINQSLQVDEKQINRSPSEYEIVLQLNGKRATEIGHGKQKVKQRAAHHLIELLGKQNVFAALIGKYNATRYHGMQPVQRLQKIVSTITFDEDVQYTEVDSLDKVNELGHRVREIIVEAEFKDVVARGTGTTFKEAKNDAAANILKQKGFAVTYQKTNENH